MFDFSQQCHVNLIRMDKTVRIQKAILHTECRSAIAGSVVWAIQDETAFGWMILYVSAVIMHASTLHASVYMWSCESASDKRACVLTDLSNTKQRQTNHKFHVARVVP